MALRVHSKAFELLYLRFDVFGGIVVLALDGKLLLCLEIRQLRRNRLQPVDHVLQSLGLVKIFITDRLVLLLLQLLDLRESIVVHPCRRVHARWWALVRMVHELRRSGWQ